MKNVWDDKEKYDKGILKRIQREKFMFEVNVLLKLVYIINKH